MLKVLVGMGTVALATVLPVSAAFAPSPIASAVTQQRKLGYAPCTPNVAPLPADVAAKGTVADADNGIHSGNCEIRMGDGYTLPDEMLETVAWHEVCHLSTVQLIAQSGDWSEYGEDWAHAHPRFKQCLRFGPKDTMGY